MFSATSTGSAPATDEPGLSKALHLIKLYACEPIGVDDVANASGVSRRALHEKFSKHLGRSI